ncbi:hypothetical protein RclHR1_20570003 [Rhizophagus clarus]|uniref:Uncharacterized protein n=1 Tax=Rhizophagus clarus TaxID=94130 RepID=A0A2Z6RK90_9GLOM|nr:hypothetical protein RclHR1_20570003 [Rhizophagus clarus]
MNVKLDDNSCKSIYVRPSFFLNIILTLSCLKTHESIFLFVTVQIYESAVETEFSTSSAAALSALSNNVSNGLNVSMHARTMTPASPSNTSPDKATAKDPPVDQLFIRTPTFSIKKK